MVKIMSKTKEDNWENILKGHFNDEVYKKFRKLYPDDFLEKEYNHWKKDFGLSKKTFIESYTSPSGEWLYAPDLPNYNSGIFICDKNYDPLADDTTIFSGTGKPFQVFKVKNQTNVWEEPFPKVTAQGTHYHYLVLINLLGSIKNVTTDAVISNEAFLHISPSINNYAHYVSVMKSIPSIKCELIKNITYDRILKITELVKKPEFTIKNITPDIQNQVIDLIIYIAGKTMYKSAKELLKLFWTTPQLKDSLDSSCSSKLALCLPKIEKSFAIEEATDLPRTEIGIIGEYLSETSETYDLFYH